MKNALLFFILLSPLLAFSKGISLSVDVGSIDASRGGVVFAQSTVPAEYAGLLLETRCYGTNNRHTTNPLAPDATVTTSLEIRSSKFSKNYDLRFPGRMTSSGGSSEVEQQGIAAEHWKMACLDYCAKNPKHCKKMKKKKCKWYKCLAKGITQIVEGLGKFVIGDSSEAFKRMGKGAVCVSGSAFAGYAEDALRDSCMGGSKERKSLLRNLGDMNTASVQAKFVDAMNNGTDPCAEMPVDLWANSNNVCREITKNEYAPELVLSQPIHYQCRVPASYKGDDGLTGATANCDLVDNRCASEKVCETLCSLYREQEDALRCVSRCGAEVYAKRADYDNPESFECSINGDTSNPNCLGRFLHGELTGIAELTGEEKVSVKHKQYREGARDCSEMGASHKWGGRYKGCNGELSAKDTYSIYNEKNLLHVKAEFPGEDGFCGGYHSPLMLFFDYNHAQFTNRSDFVGREIGIGETFWPEAEHPGYFLAYLEPGEKTISSSQRLFGQNNMWRDGFMALAAVDENMDGVIDKNDPIFSKLRLWKDIDGNGSSSQDELFKLDEFGIKSISLDYDHTYRFNYNNRAIAKGRVFVEYEKQGKKGRAELVDVFLKEFDYL